LGFARYANDLAIPATALLELSNLTMPCQPSTGLTEQAKGLAERACGKNDPLINITVTLPVISPYQALRLAL
jgi:hypothetical protein